MKKMAYDGQGEWWIKAHADYPHKDCCLIWPFGTNSTGYGLTTFEGEKQSYAHRAMCKHVKGDPPTPAHQAAHSCERGADGCVNPHHLDWKTPSENQHDRSNMRHRAKRKLTAEAVDDIRACKDREQVTLTAERHGVTEAAVRQIQAGKLYSQSARQERVFTEAEVHRIRRGEERQVDLAREFGVSHTVIWNIQHRKNYKYIPEENAGLPAAFGILT